MQKAKIRIINTVYLTFNTIFQPKAIFIGKDVDDLIECFPITLRVKYY